MDLLKTFMETGKDNVEVENFNLIAFHASLAKWKGDAASFTSLVIDSLHEERWGRSKLLTYSLLQPALDLLYCINQSG